MKEIAILAFMFLITTNIAVASGNYKRKSPQSPPITHQPYEKSEKSLKDYVYEIERKNVSIHHFSLDGKTFIIKGNFSNTMDFDNFVDRLKGNGEVDRKIEIKKSKDGYAGSTSYTFEIEALNVWK